MAQQQLSDVQTPKAIAERMSEVKDELAAHAARDPDFREELMSDPQATIEKEYGLAAGDLSDITFNVVAETPNTIVIPVPPDTSEMELSDEQLEQVSGGAAFVAVTCAVIATVPVVIATAQSTREGRTW